MVLIPDTPDRFNPARVVAALIMGNDGLTLIDTPTGESGDTALAVHIEHLHQTIWNHYFKFEDGTASTLNGAVSAGDRDVVLADASGFSVGDQVDLARGIVHQHMYRQITAISVNDVTLNAGVDLDLPDGSTVDKATFNMAVNGSVTPVVFTAVARLTEKVDVMRLLVGLVNATAADDSKFGNLAALTNGVHVRRNIDNGASYETLAIWQDNKAMKNDMFDLDYTDKSGGGNHGVNGRWTIFETGAVANIDGTVPETFECVIQDDLTSLIDFQVKLQGHIEV